MHIGVLSYGLAALAFFLFALLLLLNWRGRLQGALLAAAAASTAIWAGTLTYSLIVSSAWPGAVMALEYARDGLWLAFLYQLLESRVRVAGKAPTRLRRRFLVGLVVLALLALASIAASGLPHLALPGWLRSLGGLGLLLASLTGMALIEQLYRNAAETERWAIKYFCLGLGALFAYDFYLYSEGLLLKHLDEDVWSARGLANALVVPLLAVSAARNPQWSVNLHVSRRMVFHTATLMGAGVYLLLMAAAGYYIRYFGGSWGAVLQSVFLFGALVVLAVVVFSGAMRARLKVFLSKHFFSYKYDYREEWLRFTRTLSTGEPTAVRERALQAVAGLVDSPGAALWLAQEDGSFTFAAHWNFPVSPEPVAQAASLVRFLRSRQWVVNLEEYADSPDLYGDLVLPAWLEARRDAWLVVPLMVHEDLIGFMVLAHPRSRRGFNWEDSDLLKTAGRQAAAHLAQASALEALAQARQFESFNRFSAFVVHDVKNVVAQLSLMLKNAERHKHNPEFQEDMLATVDHAVQKMSRLLSQLRAGYQSAQGVGLLNLRDVLASVVAEKAAYRPQPRFETAVEEAWVVAERERLARVLGHLVQNAIEATPDTGRVEVTLDAVDGQAVIQVRDTGRGMDETFLHTQLFRPFASTKRAGMGIGAYECREYVRELKGDIRVESRLGKGTTFTLTLPLTRRDNQREGAWPLEGASSG
ncbi:XrtA/PEP-CTERM system histidine kinase PrsK [Thiobacter aerophilum]|uniref:histidine kinase n=1 Tax=Thiobacter aerophilum TaxID=3121275 RepID=A0ABV0ECT7_9BURK